MNTHWIALCRGKRENGFSFCSHHRHCRYTIIISTVESKKREKKPNNIVYTHFSYGVWLTNHVAKQQVQSSVFRFWMKENVCVEYRAHAICTMCSMFCVCGEFCWIWISFSEKWKTKASGVRKRKNGETTMWSLHIDWKNKKKLFSHWSFNSSYLEKIYSLLLLTFTKGKRFRNVNTKNNNWPRCCCCSQVKTTKIPWYKFQFQLKIKTNF